MSRVPKMRAPINKYVMYLLHGCFKVGHGDKGKAFKPLRDRRGFAPASTRGGRGLKAAVVRQVSP